MGFWKCVLRIAGWKADISVPHRDKCVICVAPHTSNWDFPIGYAAYRSVGRKANFLMKEFWFFFPLSCLLKAMGGIPVPKAKGADLTASIVRRMKASETMNLAITPEGTRSARAEWRSGMFYIAADAQVPIQLGVIDYSRKRVEIKEEYFSTGNIKEDMAAVKAFYADKAHCARYPEKFKT